MADGLYYLHGIRIVHGDLKCQNVLVFMSPAGPVPLICDFGMSKVLDIGGFTTQSVGRTKDFIAPELYDGSMAPNYATDIWAFGVISDQLFTDCNPVNRHHNSKTAFSGAINSLHKTIQPCWHDKPIRHPDSKMLAEALGQIYQDSISVDTMVEDAFCL